MKRSGHFKKCIKPISVIGEDGKVVVDGMPAAPAALVFGAVLYLMDIHHIMDRMTTFITVMMIP